MHIIFGRTRMLCRFSRNQKKLQLLAALACGIFYPWAYKRALAAWTRSGIKAVRIAAIPQYKLPIAQSVAGIAMQIAANPGDTLLMLNGMFH
jgi:hypothetical protein